MELCSENKKENLFYWRSSFMILVCIMMIDIEQYGDT